MSKRKLKWVQTLLICYCALYCLRFAQLNFGCRQPIAALYLPHNLVLGDTELLMYNEDCLDEIVAHIGLIDLNGDLKKEFIFDQRRFGLDYNTIYSIESNGTFRCIANFYTHDKLPLYIPPLTIWGYPAVLTDDEHCRYVLNKWDSTQKCYVHEKQTEKNDTP